MLPMRVLLISALAMLAFAGNSVFGRLALKTTSIDPATYMSLRLISAATVLAFIMVWRGKTAAREGNWASAIALFAYAVGFSLSYMNLTAGTGALLLFGAVQVTMISVSLRRGEKMNSLQALGFALALAGLVGLVMPGLEAPPLTASALMIASGVAWGIYSLRGRGAADATAATAGNFLRTVPMTVLFSAVMFGEFRFDNSGALYAVLSGAITSGLGYALWYKALAGLRPLQASIVQLSVPILATFGGVMFIAESVTLRLILVSVAVLGGILLVIVERTTAHP